MSDLDDLEIIINSRIPMILVESPEEARVVALFRRISARTGRPLYRWAVGSGVQRLDGAQAGASGYPKPAEALGYVLDLSAPAIFLLLDFHPYLDDPLNVRLLREFAQRADGLERTVVLVSPKLELPMELAHHAARFALALPGPEQLHELVLDEARAWNGRNAGQMVKARSQHLEELERNLAGLTLTDARRLVRNAIYDDGAITESDVAGVMQAKHRLLDQGGVLSFEMDTVELEDVAGLEHLKQWLERRRAVFLAALAPPGLDPPKGLLLLGVQGGGKSLAAKAVAGAWGVPLLRLDFATLYNKYYGETERNLRESFKTAELMAPCVLWMDEIEKGLATDQDGGGPSRRILGTLLTWMAEREEKVFFVATANDIESLPPELMRKGRFDEIFFVDLPTPPVRRAIFEIHLRKRGQDPAAFDLEQLADRSEGFSGAEIEQATVAALYSANALEQPLGTEHVVAELAQTRPLSVLMAEKIQYLRAWAATRTVMAG